MEHEEKITEVRESGHGEPVDGSVFLARVIYFIFGVIIALIAVRIVLLLLGANQGNAFVDFVYGLSGVFVAPFYGIFNNTPVLGRSVLDISAVVAVIIYALISWGIIALVTLGTRNRRAV